MHSLRLFKYFAVFVRLALVCPNEVTLLYFSPRGLIGRVIMHCGVIYNQLFAALNVRIRHGSSLKQGVGVRVQGVEEQLLALRKLYYSALVHNGNSVRYEADNA